MSTEVLVAKESEAQVANGAVEDETEKMQRAARQSGYHNLGLVAHSGLSNDMEQLNSILPILTSHLTSRSNYHLCPASDLYGPCRFMWTLYSSNPEHWVPISTVSSFKRMREFKALGDEWVVKALKLSKDLEIDETNTKVRRTTEIQQPKGNFERSVYAVSQSW